MVHLRTFTLFIIILILTFAPGSPDSDDGFDTDAESAPSSPADDPEKDDGHADPARENTLLIPPEISGLQPRKIKKFKDLIFKAKPVFEELLSKAQRNIVDIADKVFQLKFNMLPVRKPGSVDGEGSNEAMEVKAFELLACIVARAVRNTLICSTAVNSQSRYGRGCAREGMSILSESQTGKKVLDQLCSSTDDENEDCKKADTSTQGTTGLQGVFALPALKCVFIVRSTSKTGAATLLPSNGDLEDAINQAIWKVDAPTKIILSMFPFEFLKRLDLDKRINRKIASAFTQKYGISEAHNILEIQWPEIPAKRFSIVQLASRFLNTARVIARLLARWHKKNMIALEKVHIIACSMGAHLAGVVGDLIKQLAGVTIGRITGLDPLGWGFDELDGFGVGTELELTKEDAKFVDIIHTSAPDSSFPYIHYGSNEQRGTVDFYPNNGRARYCAPTDGLCHHFYSVVLYTSSILGKNFTACKCSSWDNFVIRGKCTPCPQIVKMGETVEKSLAKGVYYIATA